jgi:hypothetical protein
MTSARTKLTLALGFGLGYVLGSKAGRQRYQQITDLAHRIAGDPRVQDAVETVKTEAASAAVTAKQVVEDKLHRKSSSNGLVEPYPVDPVITAG